MRVAVLPARVRVVWHTTSITVTTAKDEKSMRQGLRFLRKGQSPVSIVSRWFAGAAADGGEGASSPLQEASRQGPDRSFCEATGTEQGAPLETSLPLSGTRSLMGYRRRGSEPPLWSTRSRQTDSTLGKSERSASQSGFCPHNSPRPFPPVPPSVELSSGSDWSAPRGRVVQAAQV
ncbi:hypothetical protein EYF80_044023 [Liparis tanakae]|uniref:Uncharacterized protein n=1 Tax=Liparis tanakae TaxID=230148 RepID=A0A4Z2FY16_9TELE|nr:hypothetical protein EYF80_044023 [Liparis tanakae]